MKHKVTITLKVGRLKPYVLCGDTLNAHRTREIIATTLRDIFAQHGMRER